jgi:predicted permease
MRVLRLLDNLRSDVRHAARSLRRSPGFAAVALLALAIGIGANTAIFSVIDATRAEALPFEDPDRLVGLFGNVDRGTVERRGASYPDFADWRAQSRSFEDLAAYDAQLMTLSGTGESERIDTEFVSASYFPVLRVTPARGRVFQANEDDIAQPTRVVVLSDGLWRRRFNADPQIVDRAITLNGQPYTVVGVMPPGFTGITDRAQLWIPFAMWASSSTMNDRGARGFPVLGRLMPGSTASTAQAEIDTIAARLALTYPRSNEARGVEVVALANELYGRLRTVLRLVMVAVALVLLIACANVANLLIARSEARRREIALRVAIGAGRGRLLQQLVTESCVLTLAAAAVGLVLAQALITLLVTQSPVPFPSILIPALDGRVAAFAIGVSLLCGVAVGLAPWWQVSLARRAGPFGPAAISAWLAESSRGGDSPRSQRLRNGLVVAEISLAVVLLVGASLMVQSVRNLSTVNPGFDPTSVLTVHVSIPRASARPGPLVEGRVLLEQLRAIPGVVSAGLGTDLPLDGNAAAVFYVADGQPEAFSAQNRPRTYLHRVSPEFFSALRIPFISGRTFLDSETTATSTSVIVSRRVVDRFWRDQDPIGKRIKFGRIDADGPWLTIVGVVGDVKYRGIPDNPTPDPDVYVPFADRNAQFAFAIRTSLPPASVIEPVRAAIRSIDSSIPIYGVASMEEQIERQTARSRFTMWVLGIFASIALWLCALGIYGVVSYVVTQRTREIGIRLALGAQPREVLGSIVGWGARLIAVGIVLGGLASFVLRRAAASQFFEIALAEPAALAAVALFGAVGLAACLIPGIRATRLDPVRALRQE